jgi:signal transduction histidine kinase
MADTVEQVAERLAQLEVTVAQGFHDMELRFSAMSRKIDITVEALRGDIQTVVEVVTTLTNEMRRTTDAMRKEHSADRAVVNLALEQHARRLHDLEGQR